MIQNMLSIFGANQRMERHFSRPLGWARCVRGDIASGTVLSIPRTYFVVILEEPALLIRAISRISASGTVLAIPGTCFVVKHEEPALASRGRSLELVHRGPRWPSQGHARG